MLSSRTRVRIQRRRAPNAGDHEPEGVTFATLWEPLRKTRPPRQKGYRWSQRKYEKLQAV